MDTFMCIYTHASNIKGPRSGDVCIMAVIKNNCYLSPELRYSIKPLRTCTHTLQAHTHAHMHTHTHTHTSKACSKDGGTLASTAAPSSPAPIINRALGE